MELKNSYYDTIYKVFASIQAQKSWTSVPTEQLVCGAEYHERLIILGVLDYVFYSDSCNV